MPVESLFKQAKAACIRNVAAITDVGTAPWEFVGPIVSKVTNAEQLHELETNCPHLIGHTADVWKLLIRREIEAYAHEEPPEPTDPAKWYKLYRKLHRAEQREIQRQEELLVGQLQGLKDSAAERTSKVVDPKSLPQPKSKRPTNIPKSVDQSKLRFTSGSRTKAVSGQDVLNKARREARELSHFSRSSNLARPSHHGQILRANAPKVAPKSMVSDHQRAKANRDGAALPAKISVPERQSAVERKGSISSTSPTSPLKSRPKPTSDDSKKVVESTSSKHLRPPGGPDGEHKISKVPRLASRSPVGRDREQNRQQGNAPRPRPEADIFMAPKKRRKL